MISISKLRKTTFGLSVIITFPSLLAQFEHIRFWNILSIFNLHWQKDCKMCAIRIHMFPLIHFKTWHPLISARTVQWFVVMTLSIEMSHVSTRRQTSSDACHNVGARSGAALHKTNTVSIYSTLHMSSQKRGQPAKCHLYWVLCRTDESES